MATTHLGGNPVNTNGSLPATQTKVPAFTLVKDDLSEVTNASLAGKRVVLNIFPSVEADGEGWIHLSDRPGLGFELNEDVLRATASSQATFS